MLRYLTKVLPVIVTPKWVDTCCRPISIRNVFRYLLAVIEEPGPLAGVLKIGGADVVSYAEIMGDLRTRRWTQETAAHPVPVLAGLAIDGNRPQLDRRYRVHRGSHRRGGRRSSSRLPDNAWLQWTVEPVSGGTLLVQTARFHPRGLFGRA